MSKLKDVADKAGVSLATASLALNDSNLVNKKTKEKVKYWAGKLGYYPNIYAQKLAKRKSYNICIMINSRYFFKSPNIYYLRVIGGIIREAETTEYTISFTFYGDKNDTDLISVRNSIQNVDGVIVFDVIDKKTLDLIVQTTDKPVLLIDNHMQYENIYGVDNDDLGGAYKATKYLIDLGHKSIGYIGLPDSHPLGFQCWQGFKKALKDSKIKESSVYKECRFGIRSGRKAIDYLLKKDTLPTAFFCVNDYMAIGAIEQLKSYNIKVPDDISIIGMDDMEFSSEIEPHLTTVRIRMEKLGEVGIKKIIKLINGSYGGDLKTVIDNDIIIRESCREI